MVFFDMLRDARRTLAHLIRQSARSCNSGVAAGEIPERRRQVWRGVSQRGRRRRPGKLHSHISKQRAKSAGCCAGPSLPRSSGELATERNHVRHVARGHMLPRSTRVPRPLGVAVTAAIALDEMAAARITTAKYRGERRVAIRPSTRECESASILNPGHLVHPVTGDYMLFDARGEALCPTPGALASGAECGHAAGVKATQIAQ